MIEAIWRDMNKTPIDVDIIEGQAEQDLVSKISKGPDIDAPILPTPEIQLLQA
jgi:hypothetical protein